MVLVSFQPQIRQKIGDKANEIQPNPMKSSQTRVRSMAKDGSRPYEKLLIRGGAERCADGDDNGFIAAWELAGEPPALLGRVKPSQGESNQKIKNRVGGRTGASEEECLRRSTETPLQGRRDGTVPGAPLIIFHFALGGCAA
jgi:hypothetical protein